ncbi:tail tape measure protein [Pseudanabaena phage Pan1]|nr:tail tape measure protein [Pseudanabaena phage Pan1]
MVTGSRAGEQALDRVGRKAKETETQFSRLQDNMGGFRALFASIGAGIAVREFMRLSDAATNIDNRLKLVTNSTAEANAVYDELRSISNETRTSLEANADIFNRLAMATQNLGLTYREQLDLTDQLNKALVISGATAQEGGAALRQLGQALSAGKLSGDEFVSVNENLPRVMQAVADSLGVTRGELKEMAADGKLTAQVIVDAMSQASGALDTEFAKITPTIAGAFQVLSNEMLNFTRDVNAASGIGEIFANGILFLADNFNILAGAAAGLAIIIGGVLLSSIAAMTVALAANPIGLVVVAIAAATAAIGAFGSTVVSIGGQTATVWQVIKAAIMTVVDAAVAAYEAVRGAFAGMLQAASPFFSWISDWIGKFVGWWVDAATTVLGWYKSYINTMIGLFVGLVSAIKPTITEGIPALFKLAMAIAVNAVIQGAENIVNVFAKALGGIGSALDLIPGLEGTGAKITEALSVDLSGLKLDVDSYKASLSEAGAAIGEAFGSAQVDYVGAVGDAFASAGTTISESFNENLKETVATQEASQAAADLLNGSFNSTTGAAGAAGAAVEDMGKKAGGAAKAQDDLNKKLQEFTDAIDQEFAQLMESQGGAQEQVRLWYQEQLMQLDALGLAHTAYADKLEVIFENRINEAYRKDLEAATDWRSGIERAVMGLSDSVGTEADLAESALTSVFDNAANAIANFAKTGKLDFKEFARSVAADILMLTTRMLLLKALKSVLGFSEGGEVGGGGGSPLRMATGGFVSGPGTGTSDSIPAMLSNGEFVINARATEQFLPLLEAINAGQSIAMNTGGLAVQGSLQATAPTAMPANENAESSGASAGGRAVTVNNYITSKAIAEALDTPDGETVIINIIERNRTTVKGVLS